MHNFEITKLNFVFNNLVYNISLGQVFTAAFPDFVTGYPVATYIGNVEDKFYKVRFDNGEFLEIPLQLCIATYAREKNSPTNHEESK